MQFKRSQIGLIVGFVSFAIGIILFALGLGMPGNNKTVVGAGAALVIISILSFMTALMFKLKENELEKK